MTEKMKPHPRLGINLRTAIELCGICGDDYTIGMVPMGMQNFKYICPSCGMVHYGEPPLGESKMHKCPKCSEESRAWKMIELLDKEAVKTGIGCCTSCREKLGDSRVACIEIKDGSQSDRTGAVYFIEPQGELKEALGAERVINVEESMAIKLGLDKAKTKN